MNRYALWKYITIVVAVVIGLVYTTPNFFGESPAVQISPLRAGQKLDSSVQMQVEAALKAAGITSESSVFDDRAMRVRFKSTDIQIKAKDVVQKAMGDKYVVALNLLSNTPGWLTRLGAKPMFLGLDLRGGVHFLLEVDLQAALTKTLDRHSGDIKRALRDEKIRFGSVKRVGQRVEVKLADAEGVNRASITIKKIAPGLTLQPLDGTNKLVAYLGPQEIQRVQDESVKQNITTLHNRVNELGVAEPIIQQAGPSRIVVQLPGVQDTSKAKDTIGRIATLEVRMVDEENQQEGLNGNVPVESQVLDMVSSDGRAEPILVKREVLLTGDNIQGARQGFDQNNQPSIDITLDSVGAEIFRQITKENVGRRMAMILVDRDKAQVVTAPVIRAEIGGGTVQITGGSTTVEEANETALLLRAGSLAAPMKIVEERTVGPSLGAENISKGFHSTLWGFAAITLFMLVYYRLFGFVSALGLAVNLLFLIGLLSIFQATLTLPGIAAIALALGMAIDSNVLINERIREEIRNGATPHAAIHEGYDRAWHTILDSNVTTFIAGAALFLCGSGPVKGFAVVHCLGIITSMFSAVFVSRGLVNLIHGGRRLKKLYV